MLVADIKITVYIMQKLHQLQKLECNYSAGGRDSIGSPYQPEPGKMAKPKVLLPAAIFKFKMLRSVCDRIFAQDVTGGAYSTLPNTLAGLMEGRFIVQGLESNPPLEKSGHGPLNQTQQSITTRLSRTLLINIHHQYMSVTDFRETSSGSRCIETTCHHY